MDSVPLADLRWQHAKVAAEIERGFRELFATTSFVLGPHVAEFETSYARFSKVPHVIGVGSGTDALELALRALNIGPGDEVILPANSFIATALAVVRAGARPVLADCDSSFQLMDPSMIEAAITTRTRAIIPVHLFGQMAPMEPILSIARAKGLAVLEDAAQSQGAIQNGSATAHGTDIAATSFYPGKNLGAYGDGGAVLTKSKVHADKIRRLRSYGSDVKYHHPDRGFNSRLDAMQAVVLSVKLKHLAHWNELRRKAAGIYAEILGEIEGIKLPEVAPGNISVWHLYVVRVENRDEVITGLHQRGIGAAIHYPIPIHLQGAFADLKAKKGSFPNTEHAAAEILSLPLFPGISVPQQERVAVALRDSLR
jgi:dTDP-4-amino-4,6-dideoxygalactose transaminase